MVLSLSVQHDLSFFGSFFLSALVKDFLLPLVCFTNLCLGYMSILYVIDALLDSMPYHFDLLDFVSLQSVPVLLSVHV